VIARRRFVSFAADADYLLIPGTRPSGPVFALVRRDDAAVSLRRHDDVTRGELYDVRIENAPAVAAVLAEAWPRVLAHARIRHAAYLVGLCQGALDLAVARAGERRQFGQPIGRFQAPAFDLARIAAELEAARWFVYAAAWEADDGADARLSAAQALAMTADLARTATSAAMQIHGAHGATEQADIQLYYRRACVDRVWLGTPTELRREALPLLLAGYAERATPGAPAHRIW
jgi:alkylation response protein AidB-like acyl-CoA dehydrogenase